MPIHKCHIGVPGTPIDVTSWPKDEEFPIHPIGSKPKHVLRCPPNNAKPYLIPGHPYLFKIAYGWRAQQLWSEVIAYRIAALVELNVPPCFVAVDGTTGQVGALVEFFYGYPNDPEPARFIHAADSLQSHQIGPRTDRPHSIQLNLEICRGLKLDNAVDWWARVLVFDGLIGNSDRHPENWGFLERIRPGELPKLSFAPIFDNGTSLGYEHVEGKLREAGESTRLAAYIDKGRHHCGWDSASDSPTPHMDLCRRLLDAYPDARAAMRSVIAFNPSLVAGIAAEYVRFAVPIPLSDDRSHFISALVEARRQRLSAIVGD